MVWAVGGDLVMASKYRATPAPLPDRRASDIVITGESAPREISSVGLTGNTIQSPFQVSLNPFVGGKDLLKPALRLMTSYRLVIEEIEEGTVISSGKTLKRSNYNLIKNIPSKPIVRLPLCYPKFEPRLAVSCGDRSQRKCGSGVARNVASFFVRNGKSFSRKSDVITQRDKHRETVEVAGGMEPRSAEHVIFRQDHSETLLKPAGRLNQTIDVMNRFFGRSIGRLRSGHQT